MGTELDPWSARATGRRASREWSTTCLNAVPWRRAQRNARVRWRWQVKATLETWIRDFRHAARSLVRTPGFTLTVVATLALAIGANAAIFSVIRPVLLEPLPFPNADRLVHIGGTAPGTDQPEELGVPDELYFAYRESVPAIEDLGL